VCKQHDGSLYKRDPYTTPAGGRDGRSLSKARSVNHLADLGCCAPLTNSLQRKFAY
jgi:hypothetical protein